jgi:hypothetical protein
MEPRTSTEPAPKNSHDRAEDLPSRAGPAPEKGGWSILSDAVLLRICRVLASDRQVTPEWLADLRLVARLVVEPRLRRDVRLEAAMTLIASALGKLTQFNPEHLPFGYNGPRVRSRDWIEREALERVGKQIVGLMWRDAAAEVVAGAVQRAVSESIRLGFLEERQYDAWRPGMRSGTGWRTMISATPYGATKAQNTAEACQPGAVPEVTGQGTPATVGQWTKVRCRVMPCSFEAVRELTPACPQPKPIDGPTVQIGRPGEPCMVLGTRKKPLTDGQYAVVSALLQAGEDGLTKDGLEAVRPGARQILRRLKKDADWDTVILMPGQTNGRYRIRS